MELLSYYELNKCISQSKCILNNESLDYLESLLNNEISVLNKDYNDAFMTDYLCQLNFFRNLVLYNLYKGSIELFNINKKDYIDFIDTVDRFNINYIKDGVYYNIYSLEYKNDIPNIKLYSKKNHNFSCSDVDDFVLKYIEDEMIITSEKERILDSFLLNNNLSLSDFDEDLKGEKVKKFQYANIYIK